LLEYDLNVTDTLVGYDMIIGRDILEDLGVIIDFNQKVSIWGHRECPFKSTDATVETSYFVEEPEAVQHATDRIKKILDANYEKADPHEIAAAQDHLTPEQQEQLEQLLRKYESLTDGTLGQWVGDPYEIQLKPGAKPYHAKAFPVPRVHLDVFKREIERYVKLGVLKKVNCSEWAAPCYLIPKTDQTARFINDFRELNKRIVRKPYPIPRIQDMLLNLEGFQYTTSLDLNMGYYHIELSPNSKKLCTLVTPFGKYEMQKLPMGLCNSPDIFQEKVSILMEGLEFVRTYIDDLLVLSKGSFEDHLLKLELVLQRLQKAGLKVNAKKSFFARPELEYLGYVINCDGMKPSRKKVEAIQKIAEPKTRKQLRGFIGLVNYYRNMWIRRSHVLAPLSKLCSKNVTWKWTEAHRKAFNEAKKIVARDVMLAYPDFNKEFVIHTDASHTQLGAVISQDRKPIAFFSRKLNGAQTRYTTTERELLSIVETLKEFRSILLGMKIVVYTDHKNLTYTNFNTERVMRWRLILEEFDPDLRYVKGESNIVADALSRLDMAPCRSEELNAFIEEHYAARKEDYPADFPISYRLLQSEQQKDCEVKKLLQDHPDDYSKVTRKHGDYDYELVVDKEGRIYVPKQLQKRTATWYHEMLMHPGETRTELTIAHHYTWKGMRKTVKHVCSRCDSCQHNKRRHPKLGKLNPKDPEVVPWQTVCIDLIGPYPIGEIKKDKKGKVISDTLTTLHAMTMVDPATGWFEIIEVPNKRADYITNLFEQVWLARYPWPAKVVMDRGREFMGEVIDLLRNNGIVRRPITTRNPQANAMVERAHQTIHNMIRTQKLRSKHDLPDGWIGVLTAIALGMRATIHTTNRASPTQLVFGRDHFLNVNFEANWQYIKHRKQRMIVQNNKRENAKRAPHQYNIGDKVLVLADPNRKHGEDEYLPAPHTVTHVYGNNTLRLRHETPSGGAKYQTWNLRQVKPYKD
jgi:hypothetical protein